MLRGKCGLRDMAQSCLVVLSFGFILHGALLRANASYTSKLNRLWESLAFAFTNSDGPYADLRYMKAEEVTLEDAERALMPYLSDLPKPCEYS